MLRANQAVRLGLRAASRNPELSFAKALIDQGGNLLAVLPLVLGALLVAGAARGEIVTAGALAARAGGGRARARRAAAPGAGGDGLAPPRRLRRRARARVQREPLLLGRRRAAPGSGRGARSP